MPEGVQKRHRTLKNTPETCPKLHGKIMPQKTGKFRQKTSRRHPEAPKNRLKTDPEIHLGPHGPIIWPKVPRSSHFAAFCLFRLPFCVVFGRNVRPQKQLTRQAPKRKTSLRSSIYLRGFVNCIHFSRVGGSASHINIKCSS